MKFFYSFFLTMVLFYACTSRPVEPSRSSRHTIDTLFQQQVILRKPEMDSICNQISTSIYTSAVDSIMNLRKREMNILVE